MLTTVKIVSLGSLVFSLFMSAAGAQVAGEECVQNAAQLTQHPGISAAVNGVNLFTTWRGPLGVTMAVAPETGVAIVSLPRLMGGQSQSYQAKLCVNFNVDPRRPYMLVLKQDSVIRVDFEDESLLTFNAPPELTGKGIWAKFKRSTNNN